MLRRKVKIGFGSYIAGGESLSIFSVMECAIRMSKIRTVWFKEDEKPLTLQETFYLATKGGGEFFYIE
jgi:guanine deaminase